MRKIPCCVMLSAIMLLTTACDESEPQVSGSAPALTSATTVSTADPDENAPTDATIKEVSSASFTPDGNSGKIKWLGYYDLAVDGKSMDARLGREAVRPLAGHDESRKIRPYFR